MNIVPKKKLMAQGPARQCLSHRRWQAGEVATLFTIATLLVMAVGTFIGAQKIVQDTVFKLGGFAYDYSKKAHFYTGPSIDDKGSFLLVRGSLCFTGTTIGSQPGRFWVHTPKDPNRGYPQKTCDNTNADPKDDCIIYEGKTVEYIAPQASRPYCDSPDVGKRNWRAWDFTLKLVKPISQEACNGLFVTSSSSFVFRDEIDTGGKSWGALLKEHGIDCGPLESPTPQPTTIPTISITPPGPSVRVISLTPVPTLPPGCGQRCGGISGPVCGPGLRCVTPTPGQPNPSGPIVIIRPGTCRPIDPKIICPPTTPTPTSPPVVTRIIIFPPRPSVTPICRTDLTCSRTTFCPTGYTCLAEERSGNGQCISNNPACHLTGVPTAVPTITPTGNPTASPLQAKIRGDIVVNSCRRPDNMTSMICPKNDFNPADCSERAAPITFVGQDPANPNRWLYKYEHTAAPRGPGLIDEPIERGVLYENLQIFAQYNTPGRIRQPGVIGFPPAQLGNVRGHALIPPTENEAIINYEVDKSDLVCPPPVSPTPIASVTPGLCRFNATVEVVDESLNPIPFSQAGDLNLWGTTNDKQTRTPDTLFSSKAVVDPTVGEKTMKFNVSSNNFQFYPAPGGLYTQGERASVRLFFDTSRWEFARDASGTVKKLACQGIGCPTAREPVPGHRDDQYGDTDTGFKMDCGTNIARYGWILKKKPFVAPECVMRDPENAARCTPKNVEADLISTSTVRLRWDRPEDSCDFRVGVNGDHYRADIIDMSEDPTKIITTCDNLTSTRADCTLSSSYNPTRDGRRGNFKKGHNYNVNVFAVKDIQGSGAVCLSINGKVGFTRDDDTDPVPTDNPEPPVPPVGGEVLTRQLDWMVGDKGVCWAGWSHGDCRLAYNGTNDWRKSQNDGRFNCLAPYNQNKVMIGLRKGESEVTVGTKKVDCSGNLSNACNAAPGTNISQCESNLPNATTYTGGERTLKQGECWTLDENLGIVPFSCPQTDPDQNSPQPPPRNPTDPTPAPSSKASKNIQMIVKFHTNKKAGEIRWDAFYLLFEPNLGQNENPKLVDTKREHYAQPYNQAFGSTSRFTITDEFDYLIVPVIVDSEGGIVGSQAVLNESSLSKCQKILDTSLGTNEACGLSGTEDGGDGRIEFDVYDVDVTAPTLKPTSTAPTKKPTPRPTAKPSPKNGSATLQAEADATIQSNNIDKNLGGDTVLIIGNESRILIRDKYFVTYMKFNLDNYKGKKIKTATLSLPISGNNIGIGKKITFMVKNIASDWSESDITWRNKPATIGSPLSTINMTHLSEPTEFEFDIPAQVVQNWANNSLLNRGFAIGTNENEGNINVYSSESSFGHPTLQITYDETTTAVTSTGGTRSQSTISLNNASGQSIDSVSVALCNTQNKCTSNDIDVSLRSGGSTKMKPDFAIPSDTRKISCVVQYADGSRKQCPPQSLTATGGSLQFNINTNADGTVRTALVSPLKSADLNGDCVITGADSSLLSGSYGVRGVGLKGDIDGDGIIGSKDMSLLLGLLGKNACVN